MKRKENKLYFKGVVSVYSDQLLQEEYTDDVIKDVQTIIERTQNTAYQAVNIAMLRRNWLLGKRIAKEEFYKFFPNIFHAVSGKYQLLSWTKYIKYFYELYSPLYEIRQQLVDELFSIPWGHHVQIISKCKGNAQSTTHSETPKRYSKTWEAILKYHGTTVVNDLTLLL
jgi:hypothetical protein